MRTNADTVSLSEKQIAKIIKKSIDVFSASWKPDNTSFIIPLVKDNSILAKIVCQDPFRSIKEGVWEICVYDDGYREGKEPAKSAKGTSLTNLLPLFAGGYDESSKFSVKSDTDFGVVMLTPHQVRKLLGYVTLVSDEGYSEPMKMKVKLVVETGDTKFAYLLASPDDLYDAELSFGGRKIPFPIGELLDEERQRENQ
jgi:hypothetical protein